MELIKTALQYSAWPIFTFMGLLLFRNSINKLLNNIRFFKSGSLEIGFSQQLLNQGFTDTQLKVVHSLTAQEIDLFLLVSFSNDESFKYNLGIDKTLFRQLLIKLQDAGLIIITNPENLGDDIKHFTTPIGMRVRAMLIESTVILLHSNT